MRLVEIVLLAFGLAMDATAVAGARGLVAPRVRVRDAAKVAAFFGGFQALMPAIGWSAGEVVARHVASFSHWLVFAVLAGIGAKMIHEARQADDSAADPPGDPFGVKLLAVLAVATSIDALAAGVTLAMAGVSIVLACAVIGLVTAVLSFAGVYAGRRFGARLGRRLDMAGGLVLIALGLKSLAEHYFGG